MNIDEILGTAYLIFFNCHNHQIIKVCGKILQFGKDLPKFPTILPLKY